MGPLCRGRTVLRFLANSYHLSTVELALKGVLCIRLGSKGSLIPGFPRLLTRRRYAMLMGPNRGETAFQGCHCRGGTVAVHMGKVLTIPQSWYVYFSVYFRIATFCCPKTHSEIISFGCLGGSESEEKALNSSLVSEFWNNQPFCFYNVFIYNSLFNITCKFCFLLLSFSNKLYPFRFTDSWRANRAYS